MVLGLKAASSKLCGTTHSSSGACLRRKAIRCVVSQNCCSFCSGHGKKKRHLALFFKQYKLVQACMYSRVCMARIKKAQSSVSLGYLVSPCMLKRTSSACTRAVSVRKYASSSAFMCTSFPTFGCHCRACDSSRTGRGLYPSASFLRLFHVRMWPCKAFRVCSSVRSQYATFTPRGVLL